MSSESEPAVRATPVSLFYQVNETRPKAPDMAQCPCFISLDCGVAQEGASCLPTCFAMVTSSRNEPAVTGGLSATAGPRCMRSQRC